MPFYEYEILDDKNQPTGEIVEFRQNMSEEAYTKHPDDGRPVRRMISAPQVRDSKPAWERCSDVRDYIKSAKPKWVSDTAKGIRERFDPRKHG